MAEGTERVEIGGTGLRVSRIGFGTSGLGDMPGTYGIPVSEIQDGIKHGVRKINVDTDMRLAMTGAIRKHLHDHPADFDPRDYLKPARAAAAEMYKARMLAFGQAGHAGEYAPKTLDDLKAVYKEPATA